MTATTHHMPMPTLSVAGSGRIETRTGQGVFAIDEFLKRVYELASKGDLQSATDKIFDYIDQRLNEESFSFCNAILGRIDVRRLPSALLRSFLTITYAPKDKLPARGAFYDQALQEMNRLKDNETALRLLGNLA